MAIKKLREKHAFKERVIDAVNPIQNAIYSFQKWVNNNPDFLLPNEKEAQRAAINYTIGYLKAKLDKL